MKGSVKEDFYNGVNEFVRFAISNNRNYEELRCPCSKCKLMRFHKPDIVKVHLYKSGFVPNYYLWDRHGELVAPTVNPVASEVELVTTNPIEDMVEDAARSMFPTGQVDDDDVNIEEEPNTEARKIYDLLASAKRSLWNGCESGIELSVTSEYITMKSKFNLTEAAFTAVVQAAKRHMPPNNLMCDSHYKVKTLMSAFGLPYQKIDTCVKGCMLYWKDEI